MKLWCAKHNHHWNIFDGYSVLCAVDTKEQAEHIVHCVNSHERLVEALKDAADMLQIAGEWTAEQNARTLLDALEPRKGVSCEGENRR